MTVTVVKEFTDRILAEPHTHQSRHLVKTFLILIITMAEGAEKKVEKEKENADTKGWLYKWTNYIKGYQKRWFVLQNGLLSYYR